MSKSNAMKYRVRIMDGHDQYDDSWDVDSKADALATARQYLRDLDSGVMSPTSYGNTWLVPRDPFALINTVGTDPARPDDIHWPTTTSITLGPDGEEIR